MKYFKFKFLMVLLALAAAIPPAWADGSLLVCDGTATNTYLPFYGQGYYLQSNQMIYPASMLGDMAGKDITGVTFYAKSALTSGATFNVALRTTTQSIFSEATAITGMSTVATGKTLSTSGAEVVIEFDEPFAYDGSNLVVEITVTGQGGYNSNTFYGVSQESSSFYNYSYSSGYWSGSVQSFLPKATFTYGDAQPYAASVKPTSIDFGKTIPGNTATQNITVKNLGTNPFTPSISGLSAPFSTSYTPAELAQGETATIPVVYAPTATGEFDGTVEVSFSVSDIAPVNVTLNGLCVNEVTICDGTTLNNYIPFYGYYYDNYQINQMIYPESMLNNLKGKKIKSMTFYGDNIVLKGGAYTFKLGITENSSFSQKARITEGLTTVATVDDGTHSGTELYVVFDEPIVYNGGNLLIDFEETTPGDNYPQNNFFGIYASAASFSSYNSSNQTDANGVYERGSIQNFLPKVTFAYENAGETPVVTVDAPVFNPEDGTTFEENLTVSLTCATAGATIQYSYNGEYFTNYSAPIVIDETTTIYAKAVLGDVESEVVQATYTKEAAPQPSTDCPAVLAFKDADNDSNTAFGNNKTSFLETVSDGAGFVGTNFHSNYVYQGVTGLKFSSKSNNGHLDFDLADQSSGSWKTSKIIVRAKKYGSDNAQLIVNASDPVTLTDEFVDYEFPIAAGTVLNAIDINAVKRLYVKSITIMHECGDEPVQVTKPTFDPAAGEYTEAQTVTIACSTPGATIHYTVDGTEPTAQSAVYSEPIAVGETMTIKAIAVKEGMTDSEIAEATYTINIPEPIESKTFVKVTAADQLVAGKKYIIVCGNKAMGTAATGNFLTAIDITGGNEVTVSDDGVAIMTLGGTQGKYTLALGANYLHGVNSTSLDFGTATEWAIADYNGTLDGYRVKHAEHNRAVRYASGYNRFGNYSTTDDNSVYGWIYVEKEEVTPEPEQVATPTFKNPTGTYTDQVMMEINCETEGATIHYTVDGTEPTAESPVYNEAIAVGQTMTIKAIAMKEGMTDSEIAEVTYTIVPAEPVATPTLSLVSGSYTGVQTLIIGCETADAVISYSTDGGESWTQGNTVTVDHDMNIIVKAEKDGMTASTATAYFVIDIPAELPTIEPIKGYYSIKNNGNGMYANIAGRKTLRFTDDADSNAGTVIYVETNDKGQVQSLRSQAADLQGYANRAMKYVPEIVQLVADKLNAVGDGKILGDDGLDALMAKFDESFDHHLYIEEAQGGYRLYGKTPSMQPVVDFYRENTHKVETKLPMLEAFINDAITKILDKTGGKGQSILQPFSLHETWQRMGGTLTEPVDEASTMAFYRQVLNDKNYVWSFAYETVMTYWERLKNNQTFIEAIGELGEYAQYIDKIEHIRPDFKYYVVQKDGKADFISEGNKDLNEGRAIWTLQPRETFTVNFPEANKYGNNYVTTLYTDFAYDLPEGVTAYKVTSITKSGYAMTVALEGTVPAQMPVMLMSNAAGDQNVTLNLNNGTAATDNLLVGPDELIKTYQIKTPQLVTLFELAKGLVGETFYTNYIEQYEHLLLKNAGTVNNKYFWGLSEDDVELCTYNEGKDCVVRSLATDDKGALAFQNNWTVATNKAFLVTEEHDVVNLMLLADVNRNGSVEIGDVTALIDILLVDPEVMAEYDYEAADVNKDGNLTIKDVTDLVDYLLSMQL